MNPTLTDAGKLGPGGRYGIACDNHRTKDKVAARHGSECDNHRTTDNVVESPLTTTTAPRTRCPSFYSATAPALDAPCLGCRPTCPPSGHHTLTTAPRPQANVPIIWSDSTGAGNTCEGLAHALFFTITSMSTASQVGL